MPVLPVYSSLSFYLNWTKSSISLYTNKQTKNFNAYYFLRIVPAIRIKCLLFHGDFIPLVRDRHFLKSKWNWKNTIYVLFLNVIEKKVGKEKQRYSEDGDGILEIW